MTLDGAGLPAKPFFNCSPKGLSIVDAGSVSNPLQLGSLEPWMEFNHGEGNVIDTVPLKVVGRERGQVAVECEGGTVHIDFKEGRVRKVTPDGEFVYMGTVEERNEGRGYMAV